MWDLIWLITLILFFFSLTILVILLIPIVIQFRGTLTKLDQALDVLNKDLPQVMTNFSDVSKSLSLATVKIETAVDNFSELERIVTNQIKVPLKTIAQIIATMLRLLTTLVSRKKR